MLIQVTVYNKNKSVFQNRQSLVRRKALFYIFANLFGVCLNRHSQVFIPTSAFSLLWCMCWLEERRKIWPTQIRSQKRQKYFNSLLICFSLIFHLNSTSGGFLKVSSRVESEILSMNFLYTCIKLHQSVLHFE